MNLGPDLRLTPFDVRAATDEQLRDLYDLFEELRREQHPHDPPDSLAALTANLRGLPDVIELRAWDVHDDAGRLVASAHVSWLRAETNRHVADFEIVVRPAWRRRGIGRTLLGLVTRTAREDGRTLLLTNATDLVPASFDTLRAAGATEGLVNHVNELDLATLDHALLEDWTRRAGERAADHELLVWDDGHPEEHLQAWVDLMKVMNTAPRGDLQTDDWEPTVELQRAWDESFRASGRRRLTSVVRHRPTGRLDGFSELWWHPDRAAIVHQSGTGVRTDTRGLGLGRWLKAENLRRLLAANGDARVVRTTNAKVNEAMLSINTELGFRPSHTHVIWQLPVERAEAFLAARV
ncbi:GNAT family N-acetyltransferase [Deinococcus pimensis]|uniref:GNAT family N-acetyltransferase n=1 Tax=Deinococcus pimensis TaxID=309888 RepID=UPI0004B6C5FC|nr:GNAT family N-acetyltransferase [Deinococcus pimensis]